MIADGRVMTGGHLDRWVVSHHVRMAARRFGSPPPFTEVSDLPPLRARIYEGLWIVDCPCAGASMVWRGHPITWCCSCGNQYTGGQWRNVELPTNWEQVEAVLSLRPFPINQNWTPAETLVDLMQENLAKDLPIPEGMPMPPPLEEALS